MMLLKGIILASALVQGPFYQSGALHDWEVNGWKAGDGGTNRCIAAYVPKTRSGVEKVLVIFSTDAKRVSMVFVNPAWKLPVNVPHSKVAFLATPHDTFSESIEFAGPDTIVIPEVDRKAIPDLVNGGTMRVVYGEAEWTVPLDGLQDLKNLVEECSDAVNSKDYAE